MPDPDPSWAIDPYIALADQRVDSLLVVYCLIHPDGSCCGDVSTTNLMLMLKHVNENHRLGAIAL